MSHSIIRQVEYERTVSYTTFLLSSVYVSLGMLVLRQPQNLALCG